jgi:glycosyltransferase involved in cell wall biosynthesis
MGQSQKSVRVLYSFPNKLGAERICYTAWQQVNGLVTAGAKLFVFPASSSRPVPEMASLHPTLAFGKMRVPFKLLGNGRAHALHDQIVARRLRKLKGQIDIIHTWPSGAKRTLETAAELGIPSVLERCNSHTRYVYETVQAESERLGVQLAQNDEAAFKEDTLRLEEKEFRLADRLLCPSEFVVQTFIDKGFTSDKLARHFYGFDHQTYHPDPNYQPNTDGLRMLFVGFCSVRKGLHFALEAWLKSSASRNGTFSIAGEFSPDYARKLSPLLAHPSIRVLGQRNDVPYLLRNNDVLTLPSLEEGFGLVCTEAMGSGCVPLVSNACTDVCQHSRNALVHRIGDVEALTQHINVMNEDRALLQRLRSAGLDERNRLTWDAAGVRLLDVYRETIDMYSQHEHTKLNPVE